MTILDTKALEALAAKLRKAASNTMLKVDQSVMREAADAIETLSAASPRSILEEAAELVTEQLKVEAKVAARSNLVGYAAEFYSALLHKLPDAIRSLAKEG